MSATYSAELAYSYRRGVSVLAGITIAGPASTDTAALAAIDAGLAAAAAAYNQRHYQEAIDGYQQGASRGSTRFPERWQRRPRRASARTFGVSGQRPSSVSRSGRYPSRSSVASPTATSASGPATNGSPNRS